MHALRVDRADDVLDDATLARRVHRLQDEEHRFRGSLRARREESLLQLGQRGHPCVELDPALLLVTVEARRR